MLDDADLVAATLDRLGDLRGEARETVYQWRNLAGHTGSVAQGAREQAAAIGRQLDDGDVADQAGRHVLRGMGGAWLAEDDQVDGVRLGQVMQQRGCAQGSAASQGVGRLRREHQRGWAAQVRRTSLAGSVGSPMFADTTLQHGGWGRSEEEGVSGCIYRWKIVGSCETGVGRGSGDRYPADAKDARLADIPRQLSPGMINDRVSCRHSYIIRRLKAKLAGTW